MTFDQLVNARLVPFVDFAVIPLLYTLAFLFFLIGVVRFFFSGSEEGRKKGKGFMIWGLVALVVLFSVWGMVRVLLSVLVGV